MSIEELLEMLKIDSKNLKTEGVFTPESIAISLDEAVKAINALNRELTEYDNALKNGLEKAIPVFKEVGTRTLEPIKGFNVLAEILLDLFSLLDTEENNKKN